MQLCLNGENVKVKLSKLKCIEDRTNVYRTVRSGMIAVGIAFATVSLRLVRKGGQGHVRKTTHTHIASPDSPEH